jgi:hypothetical protein
VCVCVCIFACVQESPHLDLPLTRQYDRDCASNEYCSKGNKCMACQSCATNNDGLFWNCNDRCQYCECQWSLSSTKKLPVQLRSLLTRTRRVGLCGLLQRRTGPRAAHLCADPFTDHSRVPRRVRGSWFSSLRPASRVGVLLRVGFDSSCDSWHKWGSV